MTITFTDPAHHICREHTQPAHTHPGWYDGPGGAYELDDDGHDWGYVTADVAAEATSIAAAYGLPVLEPKEVW